MYFVGLADKDDAGNMTESANKLGHGGDEGIAGDSSRVSLPLLEWVLTEWIPPEKPLNLNSEP